MLLKILCGHEIAKSGPDAIQILSGLIERPVRPSDKTPADVRQAAAGWNLHYASLLDQAIKSWYDKSHALVYQSASMELCVLGNAVAMRGKAVLDQYMPMWHDFVILDKTERSQIFAHTWLAPHMQSDIEHNFTAYGVYYAEID